MVALRCCSATRHRSFAQGVHIISKSSLSKEHEGEVETTHETSPKEEKLARNTTVAIEQVGTSTNGVRLSTPTSDLQDYSHWHCYGWVWAVVLGRQYPQIARNRTSTKTSYGCIACNLDCGQHIKPAPVYLRTLEPPFSTSWITTNSFYSATPPLAVRIRRSTNGLTKFVLVEFFNVATDFWTLCEGGTVAR